MAIEYLPPEKKAKNLFLFELWWVQHGARNLSGKKTKQVLCRVELKEPTCRHAAFREQVIQLLPFIQNEWREENPFTHSEYSWSVSLLRWLLFEGKQNRRKAQYSFASDAVSRRFHFTVCLSRFDKHTAIKVNHDLFDSLRQRVTRFFRATYSYPHNVIFQTGVWFYRP